MSQPGVTIINDDQRTPKGPRLRLSTTYLAGELQFGQDTPTAIRSYRELVKFFGARTSDTSAMHDWVRGWFEEGGGQVYVVPLRGPAAIAASHAFSDGTTTSFTYTARDKGADGNRLSVDIDVTGSDFNVKVYRDAVLVESSGLVPTVVAAQTWAAASRWGRITPGAGADPTATGSPAALTAGDDDWDGITTDVLGDAFDVFPADLGPGNYVLPGRTATSSQLEVAARAATRNRLARFDALAVSSATTIAAQAATLTAGPNADISDLIAPRLTIPGLTPQTTGSVPGTVLALAAEARNDAAGISPNQPAAGKWGIAQYATAPTVTWTDDELETLNDAGVRVIRVIDGDVKVYGSRTLADPDTDPAAVRIGSARLRMAITEIARYESEQIVFAELDQGGVALGDYVGLLTSGINQFAQSLYLLDVTAEVVEDEDAPGTYLVETVVEFQAAPDAERVRVVITRSVTEV